MNTGEKPTMQEPTVQEPAMQEPTKPDDAGANKDGYATAIHNAAQKVKDIATSAPQNLQDAVKGHESATAEKGQQGVGSAGDTTEQHAESGTKHKPSLIERGKEALGFGHKEHKEVK